MGTLDGRIALVTGAGRLRGIGRATALALAAEGADVIVTGSGRPAESYPDDEKRIGWRDVESTAEQIRRLGQRALTWVGDVGSGSQVRELHQRAMNEFGRVDILINNAALGPGADRAPVGELDEAVWRRVLEVKLTGAFLVSKQFLPGMVERKWGRIVNMSSNAGKRGVKNHAAYCSANFGLHGLTQALAMEVAAHGVNVHAVCPGFTDTARMDIYGRGAGSFWERHVQQVPMGRAARDEEVASLVAFLCSPAAAFMTGQAININGGSYMG